MRSTFAPLVFAALAAANPMPQGVTQSIAPAASAPAGCMASYPGTFEISVVNVTSPKSKRSADIEKRQGALMLTLNGGILKDAQGRIGYIAANRQFQFDGPPQTGAIYTAGWSVCSNGTLAIGNDAIFDECLSGTFYNLYDQATSAQCNPIYIQVIGGAKSTGVASQQPDGQVTARPVAQISDGQIQQISDGQIQNPRPTASPVKQISDGQVQAPTMTARPIGQISDGQIQASTKAAMTTGRPVGQISDGQIQASTKAMTTGRPVGQISDGQIQASTMAAMTTGRPVSQISDGQIQAPTNATKTSSRPATYTGAAAMPTLGNELFGLAAGVIALAML